MPSRTFAATEGSPAGNPAQSAPPATCTAPCWKPSTWPRVSGQGYEGLEARVPLEQSHSNCTPGGQQESPQRHRGNTCSGPQTPRRISRGSLLGEEVSPTERCLKTQGRGLTPMDVSSGKPYGWGRDDTGLHPGKAPSTWRTWAKTNCSGPGEASPPQVAPLLVREPGLVADSDLS